MVAMVIHPSPWLALEMLVGEIETPPLMAASFPVKKRLPTMDPGAANVPWDMVMPLESRVAKSVLPTSKLEPSPLLV